MRGSLRRSLMFGVALAAVIAGVILAVTPHGSRHHAHPTRSAGPRGPRSEAQLAAGYLGLSRSQLRRKLRAGRTLAQIAQSTPGRTSSGLIAVLLAGRSAQLESRGLPASKERARLASLRSQVLAAVSAQRARRGAIPVAAERMGLSEAELRRRLRGGATLAQTARATKRISVAGLIDVLMKIKTGRLRAAERSGSITAAQERTARASLQSRITREVNRKLPQR
jgi:hypothetical protein